MFNGKFKMKDKADRILQIVTKTIVKFNITANMITIIGLLLVIVASIIYYITENSLIFGIFLIISFTFDAMDGAVARLSGTTSKFGAYLDAVIDRYQESIVYLVIGIVTGHTILVYIAVTGSLLTSYHKARASMETDVENDNWPDLFERTERVASISIILMISHFITSFDFLFYSLIVISILTHVTAIQRFFRAKQRIEQEK